MGKGGEEKNIEVQPQPGTCSAYKREHGKERGGA